MKKTSYFRTIDNRAYIDVNADARRDPEDAMILRPLEPSELRLYNQRRRDKHTDEEIYAEISRLYYDEQDAILESSRAIKSQLTHHISLRVGEPLPTLERMSTEDLTKLFLAMIRRSPSPAS
jgi:hypothetical protein